MVTKKKSIKMSDLLLIAILGVSIYFFKRVRQRVQTNGKSRTDAPVNIPKQGWEKALLQTREALRDKNLPMLAAGVAFYATLAFFPTLAAFVSIFALVASPSQIAAALHTVASYMPHEMATLINSQLKLSIGKPTTNIIAAILAIAISIWSASSGVQNFIKAINEVYDVQEARKFIPLKLTSLFLALCGIVLGFPLLLLIVVQGNWISQIGVPTWIVGSFLVVRWVLVIVIMSLALAIFYRYAPNRREPRWRWVSWGAVAAILIWFIGTVVFFLYAQDFGNFSKNYGIFASIIVLMTWFNLSAFIFLLGGQVNSRLEKQTLSSAQKGP